MKIRIGYRCLVAGRYAFRAKSATFTFSTKRELYNIHDSELETVIKFKLRNKGLTVTKMFIMSKQVI